MIGATRSLTASLSLRAPWLRVHVCSHARAAPRFSCIIRKPYQNYPQRRYTSSSTSPPSSAAKPTSPVAQTIHESGPSASVPPNAEPSSLAPPPDSTPLEASIHAMLVSAPSLQPIAALRVRDISGGCGSMFAIEVESGAFRGLGVVKQHRLVNEVVGPRMREEGWHGMQLKTKGSD